MKIIQTYILCCLASCVLAQGADYVCHHEDITVFPLEKLNTGSLEFSPIYYQQGLVYVVAREKNNLLDPKTGRAYFDLMYVDLGPDGSPSKSVSFSPNIRTQYHEGPCCFSADGNEMFFTRSNLSGGKGINDEKGQVQLKIYSAKKGEEDWEQISALPFCKDDFATAHPALSTDGQYLVFASDMPGGLGGMDLYMVTRTDGTWSDPVNLGAEINSDGHELFPYWHPDGYLFFSSDKHDGMGGLDVFVTALDTSGMFKGLQHLAEPFNSKRDDLGMIVSADGTSGYLASDRKPTKGKDDLYRWTSPKSIFCTPGIHAARKKIHREISILDENRRPIENALIWVIPMNQEGPSRYKEHFTTELVPKENTSSEYYLRWSVTDTLSDESADGVADPFGIVNMEAEEKTTYVIVARHNGYEPYTQVVLGSEIPSSIILKRDTKSSGPCLGTSFTIFNASGDKQIHGAQVSISGPCLKMTEIKTTDQSGTTTFCLPKDCPVKAEITYTGYAVHNFPFTPVEDGELWKIFLKEGDENATPSPIASGTVIVLDNIYYDFNKSVIRKGDAGELIALADIMKQYPELTIELTSHTDTRGSAEYNMELSQKRSESSKSYLVLLGIDPSRINTKAAGESSPRNKCVDGVECTEAEHQYNRRTEVRITNPAQGMQIRYKAEQ
jgi:outer membrane protein OmpA-like peptidoglycan-associated protein